MSDSDEVRREQRATVWRGCQSVLGCAGVIALGALVLDGPPRLLRVLSEVPNGATLTFVYFPRLSKEVLWFTAFSFLIFLALLGTIRRAWALALLAPLVLAVLGGTAYYEWYRPFTALSVRRDDVVLHFLWPRPAIRIARASIRSTEVLETTSGGDDPQPLYCLALTTADGRYVSMWTAHRETAAAFQKRP
jgi:hypothetical protein